MFGQKHGLFSALIEKNSNLAGSLPCAQKRDEPIDGNIRSDRRLRGEDIDIGLDKVVLNHERRFTFRLRRRLSPVFGQGLCLALCFVD